MVRSGATSESDHIIAARARAFSSDCYMSRNMQRLDVQMEPNGQPEDCCHGNEDAAELMSASNTRGVFSVCAHARV